jgi:hypothetical protein
VRDLSISEYCAEAIEARLAAEIGRPAAGSVRADAVTAARQFRERTSAGPRSA